MLKRVALYTRVSTDQQTTVNQRRELQAACRRHGWRVAAIYSDNGISGLHGKDKRPGFARLCQAVARREVDGVAAWSVDRLGRSLRHLLEFIEELKAKGVDLYLHQQGVDTSTPAGKAMFSMVGVFAEFERSMLGERVRAGLARAKAEGIKLGRPRIAAAKEQEISRLLKQRLPVGRVARLVGCASGTVRRVRREFRAGSARPAATRRGSPRDPGRRGGRR